MTDPNQIIIFVGIVALLVAAFFFWKYLEKKGETRARNRFIFQVLNEALQQKSTFDLKLLGAGIHVGLATTPTAVTTSGIEMRADQPVADDWSNKPVEVYFRVKDEDAPVFYVFESQVRKLGSGDDRADIVLNLPNNLRVEKKRHFERAHPPQEAVLMVAVWPIAPGRRLPRTTADLGNPSIRWKRGEAELPVQVENISGSGIALRFARSAAGEAPFEVRKGRQIICLVVYKAEDNDLKPTVFWCTAEIMNVRVLSDGASAIGLEFTNWAIQEQGDTEIHWSHNSPWRGVKPILEWVKRIEMVHN